MAKNFLYLGTDVGSLILLSPFGRKYNIKNQELARSERMASGRLVKDIITTKKNFQLNYELIDDDSLQIFIDFYAENAELIFRDENDNGKTDYVVLIKPIDQTRIVASINSLWGNVSIELEEV